ncbi:MAG: sigma-70 family RNA polymerase sigma factor [Phycisphaerales bacterium]|nr:sigma-70 family RNA polymerase sigma factor [Phycisphaerales bacterium]
MGNAQDRDSEAQAIRLTGLLALASRGDQAAWRELVGLYARRVFAMGFSRFRNRELAEEIAQSVFATVAAKLASGDYTERGRFESWLMRVTMNRIRDEARRAARQAVPTDPASLVDIREDGQRGGAERDDDSGRFLALRDALTQLPDADREVLMLRHQGQMAFKEMSELLDEPVGTLLARHHRALRKLREIMESPDAAERARRVEGR